MNTTKTTTIEKIKNIMIAVLLVTAVLLLSFFWRTSSIGGSIVNISRTLVQSDSSYMPQTMDLIMPEYIRVGLGSGSYVMCDTSVSMDRLDFDQGHDSETLYTELLAILRDYLEQEDVTTEEIEGEQYDTVMSYSTVSAVFSFELPYAEFLKNNGLPVPQNGASVDTMTRITFSPFSSENVFVYDGDNGKYYRITTGNAEFAKEEANILSALIGSLNAVAHSNYYTIQNVAGVDNDTLIPIYMVTGLTDETFRPAFSIEDSSDVEYMENLFFSGGMDFVRRITENRGSLMYVQGYSEKVLQLSAGGRISYREEFDQSGYEEQNLYESISDAVQYVSNHGGWREIVSGGMEPYLARVEKIKAETGNYTGYNVVFGLKMDGIPVEYGSGDPISVRLLGSQVVSYEREIVLTDKGESGSTGEDNLWQAMAPMDIITNNYEMMYGEMTAAAKEANINEAGAGGAAVENGETAVTSTTAAPEKDPKNQEPPGGAGQLENFDYVAANVNRVDLCMYKGDGDESLKPCWLILAGDCRFVFDAKTGERVNTETSADTEA
ncbi:MAG: hypothetical protein K5767_05075 [Clostridia bacterium]|nr:hypothetical protein [Clostridia bacterium]